jgi:hypothetical protein
MRLHPCRREERRKPSAADGARFPPAPAAAKPFASRGFQKEAQLISAEARSLSDGRS